MGKVSKKSPKEGKKPSKLTKLFGRGQKGGASIDQPSPDYQADARETYRAIGRVNPRHLQGCQSWDVRYLGCVPQVSDWQSPGSRSEFMELVDQGQMKGQLMWHSLTPKLLHISPRWMVITDNKRKVMYAEVPIAFMGSLAYAEDDSKHIVGIKTAYQQQGSLGGWAVAGAYCCHVLECDTEGVVHQICSEVSGYFQRLLAEQEARQREQQAAQQEQQQVRPKMLKRLTTDHQPAAAAAARGEPPVKKTEPPAPKAQRKRSAKKTQPEPTPPSPPQQLRQPPPPPEAAAAVPKRKPERRPRESLSELAEHDWILSNWSANARPIPSPEGELLEEIGRQFSAITREPSRVRRPGAHIQGPKLKRLSMEGTKDGSISKRKRPPRTSPSKPSRDSIDELLPPLQFSQVRTHDGNTVLQLLEDTTGVTVPDSPELYVSKNKTRLSIMSLPSLSHPSLDPTEAEAPPPLEPMDTSEDSASPERKSVLRTSALLEVKEEGDKETRIDGDASGTVLVQTVVSEKETCVMGGVPGSTVLLPASQLSEYEREQEKLQALEKDEDTEDLAPPPKLPQPPPPPVKRERTPWPVLVRVDDISRDPAHQAYMVEVSRAMGVIEYRKLRQDWLAYQRCNIDVVTFCKRTKLLFRGDRVNLREGARVLVDPEDQPIFDDVLTGKITESASASSLPFAPPPPPTVTMPTTDTSSTPTHKPSALQTRHEMKPSTPSPSTFKSSLGSKPSMFETPAASPRGPKLVDAPSSSRSVRQLIRASEGKGGRTAGSKPMVDIGGSGMLVKPSTFKGFDETDSNPLDNKELPRPVRSNILSKIAAFEGGKMPPLEEEKEPTPPPTTPRKGRRRLGDDREEERREKRSDFHRKEGKKGDRELKKEKYSRRDESAQTRGENRDEKDHHRRGSEDSEEERSKKHRSKKDKHRRHESESEEETSSHRRKEKHRRRERDEKRKSEKRYSTGLSSILAAGSKLLEPQPVDTSTIDALSELLQEQETGGDDILQHAAQVVGLQIPDTPLEFQDIPIAPAFQQAPPTMHHVAPPTFPQVAVQQVPVHVVQTPVYPVQHPVVQPLMQPVMHVQQPVMQAQQPFMQVQQPVMQAQQPVMQVQQPVMQVQQPVMQAQQPLMQVQQPIMQQWQQPFQQPAMVQQQALSYGMQPPPPPSSIMQPPPVATDTARRQPHTSPPPATLPTPTQATLPTEGAQEGESDAAMTTPLQPPTAGGDWQTQESAFSRPVYTEPPALEGEAESSEDSETSSEEDSESEEEALTPQQPPGTIPPPPPPPPPGTTYPPPPPQAKTFPPPPPLLSGGQQKFPRAQTTAGLHENRDNMLDEIRRGGQLRKVVSENIKKSSPNDSLLSELQVGKQLRKVPDHEKNVHKKKVTRRKELTLEEVLERAQQQQRVSSAELKQRHRKHGRQDGDSSGEREHRRGWGSRDERRDKYEQEGRGGKTPRDEPDRRHHRKHASDEREERRRKKYSDEEERDSRRGRHSRDDRRPKYSSDEQYYSDDEAPPERRRQPQRSQSSAQKQPAVQEMPVWKVAVIKKRQEKERAMLQPQREEEEPPPEPKKYVRKMETYQGLPNEDEIGDDRPVWKAALLKKRQGKISEAEEAQRRHQEEEEARFEGMPAWKQKLLKKRFETQAVEEAKEREQERQKWEKAAEIAAMPEWKRKIFLEKNPQYRGLS